MSWFDCVIFANLLSEKLGFQKVYEIPNGLSLGSSQSSDLAKEVKVNKSANGYRLPTEIELGICSERRAKIHLCRKWVFERCGRLGKNRDNSEGENMLWVKKRQMVWAQMAMNGNVWEWCLIQRIAIRLYIFVE